MEKVLRITYSECVSVILGIQHATRMLVLYCHMWPVQLHNILPHYLTNGTIFGKKDIELKMRVLFDIKVLPETFLIVRRIQLYIINVYWCSCKVQLLLLYFKETCIFSTDFQKIIKQNFMKLVQWEPSCSMRTDGHNSRYSEF
jgi:hypothetical protein